MYSEILLFTACPGCLMKFLACLLAALLLGLLAGYFIWGKYKALVDGLQGDINALKAKLTDREKEYASLKYAHDELDKDNIAMRSSLSGCEADKAALQASLDRCKAEVAAGIAVGAAAGAGLSGGSGDADAGIAVGAGAGDEENTGYGAVFTSDNLQIIEGIGPKISKVLAAAGVNSWAELAGKSNDDLIAILTAGGINTKINNPKTWPEQARLANEGQWEELVKYQKFLDTGMENKGDFETPAKVEKLYLKAIGFASAKPEDLKVVEGIGPKIESLLKNAGIQNWADLAATEVSRIEEILAAAGPRYKLAKPATWPKQAELADAKKWKELKEYQDFLDGGNAPS